MVVNVTAVYASRVGTAKVSNAVLSAAVVNPVLNPVSNPKATFVAEPAVYYQSTLMLSAATMAFSGEKAPWHLNSKLDLVEYAYWMALSFLKAILTVSNVVSAVLVS